MSGARLTVPGTARTLLGNSHERGGTSIMPHAPAYNRFVSCLTSNLVFSAEWLPWARHIQGGISQSSMGTSGPARPSLIVSECLACIISNVEIQRKRYRHFTGSSPAPFDQSSFLIRRGPTLSPVSLFQATCAPLHLGNCATSHDPSAFRNIQSIVRPFACTNVLVESTNR